MNRVLLHTDSLLSLAPSCPLLERPVTTVSPLKHYPARVISSVWVQLIGMSAAGKIELLARGAQYLTGPKHGVEGLRSFAQSDQPFDALVELALVLEQIRPKNYKTN